MIFSKPLINGYFYPVYTFLSHKENVLWGHHKNDIQLNKYSIKINFLPIFYEYTRGPAHKIVRG